MTEPKALKANSLLAEQRRRLAALPGIVSARWRRRDDLDRSLLPLGIALALILAAAL